MFRNPYDGPNVHLMKQKINVHRHNELGQPWHQAEAWYLAPVASGVSVGAGVRYEAPDAVLMCRQRSELRPSSDVPHAEVAIRAPLHGMANPNYG